MRAHEFGRDEVIDVVARDDAQESVGFVKSSLHRLVEALAERGSVVGDLGIVELVDEDVDVVLLGLGEDDLLSELLDLAVHPHFLISLAEHVVEELVIFALPSDDNRRIDLEEPVFHLDSHDLLAGGSAF